MSGILDNVVSAWVGFVLFALPVGVLWMVTLIGITFLTARELWLGRRRKRRRVLPSHIPPEKRTEKRGDLFLF